MGSVGVDRRGVAAVGTVLTAAAIAASSILASWLALTAVPDGLWPSQLSTSPVWLGLAPLTVMACVVRAALDWRRGESRAARWSTGIAAAMAAESLISAGSGWLALHSGGGTWVFAVVVSLPIVGWTVVIAIAQAAGAASLGKADGRRAALPVVGATGSLIVVGVLLPGSNTVARVPAMPTLLPATFLTSPQAGFVKTLAACAWLVIGIAGPTVLGLRAARAGGAERARLAQAAAGMLLPLAVVAACATLAAVDRAVPLGRGFNGFALGLSLAVVTSSLWTSAVLHDAGRSRDTRTPETPDIVRTALWIVFAVATVQLAPLVLAVLTPVLVAPGDDAGPWAGLIAIVFAAALLQPWRLVVARCVAAVLPSPDAADARAAGPAPDADPALADADMPEPSLAVLTRREQEVLALASVGLSNQGIADRLVLSKRTVDAHLRSVFRKLDVAGDSNPRVRAAVIWLAHEPGPAYEATSSAVTKGPERRT